MAIVFSKTATADPLDCHLYINNQQLQIVNTVKMLGIHLDTHLTWCEHINVTTNKLKSTLYAMNRCKHILNADLLKTLYYGLVHSRLQYGISLWGGASVSLLSRLYVLQKRALRYIFSRLRGLPGDSLFGRGGILKLLDMRDLEDLKLAFRFHNNLLPSPISAFFLPGMISFTSMALETQLRFI